MFFLQNLICNTQNYIISKISASSLFLKYGELLRNEVITGAYWIVSRQDRRYRCANITLSSTERHTAKYNDSKMLETKWKLVLHRNSLGT